MAKQALCIRAIDFVEAEKRLFSFMNAKLIDRDICETDASTLQLLPYVVLRDVTTDKYFMYTRGKAGQENRLHAKRSVGLGGHVEEAPDDQNDLFQVLINCVLRELEEEVGYQWTVSEKEILTMKIRRGHYTLIHMPESPSPVDRVHLGIGLVLDCDRARFSALETGVILEPTWLSADDLLYSTPSSLENWSNVMICQIAD